MNIKSFLSALLPALLLSAPLCAAASPAGTEIVLHDTVEETTQPAQTLQEGEVRDWLRSVASPVPWLMVEDHILTVYDESGSKVFCGVYPSLELTDDSASPLAKALDDWSVEQSMAIWHSHVRTCSEEDRRIDGRLVTYYTDTVPISQWGRVDDRVISFFMEGSAYTGGLHPFPRIEAYTFDRVSGRQIALDEIVTDRMLLIEAIAAAFRTQYSDILQDDFPRGIMEALLIQHPAERGLTSFCWYMASDGSLIIYYPASVLTSYAAGDFALTITRDDAPGLFTGAYLME